jgi:ATP-binding cassette subfamily B protein
LRVSIISGIVAGGLGAGELIAFINYLGQALTSLMSISMLTARLARAEASAARINEVFRNTPEIAPVASAAALPAPRGRVAFQGVTFAYGASPDPALRDLSFVAEPGETIAILGATGAGKSTLLNLIPRFYDVTAGRITIDGVDIRDLDEATLRATVGVAPQEALLFSGTIAENIRYGRPDATDAEAAGAAAQAQAAEFVGRLPGGYATILGQRGVNLSGGQKQRLAIARAILPQPPILLLDDATSAVDVATEARIQAALADNARRQTRFIVAQRISAVLAADRILVLDGGRMVALGTHADLLASSPDYRAIYESQVEAGAVVHDAV